jgi:endonuclease YncB( thermonuclease family)
MNTFKVASTNGLCIFAYLMCLCLCQALHADTLLGKVIHVADGDSITVLDDTHTQHKLRLAGIDAPESKQAFGHVSKQSLTEQVAGKNVVVDWDKVDRYGRKVGKVLLDSQEQVRRSLAWHYKAYEREQSVIDREVYANAENEAKDARRGLWTDAAPEPPWEFRRRQK